MSHGRAIDPIDLSQFPTEQDTSDPGFEQLASDLLANAATDGDGWDQDIDIATGLLDSLDAALDALSGQDGGTLDEAFEEILAVDPAPAGDDVVNLQAALPEVQTNVDNLGNLLTAAAPPTAPGPPPALPPGCSAVAGFDDIANTPPIARSFNFAVESSQGVLIVDSNTLDQDTQGLFTLQNGPIGTPVPGNSFQFTVTLTATAPKGMHGKVTTKWHFAGGTGSTVHLCLGVEVPDNFPQPSQGGGGGGGVPPPHGFNCPPGTHQEAGGCTPNQ